MKDQAGRPTGYEGVAAMPVLLPSIKQLEFMIQACAEAAICHEYEQLKALVHHLKYLVPQPLQCPRRAIKYMLPLPRKILCDGIGHYIQSR